MPRHARALARIFPVMLQVDAIFDERAGGRDRRPVHFATSRVWRAAEMLTALARRQPLIIWTDDLQWADDDSIRLFGRSAATTRCATAVIDREFSR